MRKKTVFLLSLILSVAAVALAQTKTVTNADLEKFRQKRLQNERNYRENYARLGFPSPEELERRRVEDEKNLIEFSRQLETQRLERETLQAEAANQALFLQNQYLQSQGYSNYNSGRYFYDGYSPYYYGSGYYRSNRRPTFNSTYKSGFSNSYPWMIIPQFRNRRTTRPLLPQIRSPRNVNPRIKIRTGRGRN